MKLTREELATALKEAFLEQQSHFALRNTKQPSGTVRLDGDFNLEEVINHVLKREAEKK